LDALCNSFLKKWLKIPRSGTLAGLYSSGSLEIRNNFHIYKECHASAFVHLKRSLDSRVQDALVSKLGREESLSRKFSIVHYSQKLYTAAVQAIEDNPTRSNPVPTKKCITSKIKDMISDEIRNLWNTKVKTLLVQGRFLQIIQAENSCFTWKHIIYELPRGVLQFVLNASTDSLPTLANLGRWRLRSFNNIKCPLCQNSQTLHHVLNFCKTMLDQGRYTWRHDSVLAYLASLFKNLENVKIYSDLGCKKGETITTVPPEVLPTSQRPDLVIYWLNLKKICIIELTIPFETNIQNSHQKKVNKYASLVHDLSDKGLKVDFYAFEVGSRGFLSADNLGTLKSLLHLSKSSQSFKRVRNDLEKIVLCTSFSIYCSKAEPSWLEPPLFEI
jgi:hypothetical protein